MTHFIASQCQNKAVRSGNYPDHLRLRLFCHFYISLSEVSLSEAEYAAFQRQYSAYKVKYLFPSKIELCIFTGEPLYPFTPQGGLHYWSLLTSACPGSLAVWGEGDGCAYMAPLISPIFWYLAARREHSSDFSWPCGVYDIHIPDLSRDSCYFQVCCDWFCK